MRRGASAPGDVSGGTAICTLTPADTDCVDSTAKSGTSYGYAVFAVDAAGNKARREATAKALDTQAPDAVANFKVVSFDRTYARLGWTVPALKGADADVAGYRVIKLRPGAKTPLSPSDGTVVCRNDDQTRQHLRCDARPDDRQEGHVRRLRARRGAQLLGARADLAGAALGRQEAAAQADEGAAARAPG